MRNRKVIVVAVASMVATLLLATVITNEPICLETNGDLVVPASATPVCTFADDDTVTGNPPQYNTPGLKMVCGVQNVVGSATIAHGLAMPVDGAANWGANLHDDDLYLQSEEQCGVLTLFVRKYKHATPVVAETPVPVHWCVIGY